ncbi:17295_t:CDS:1 [Cetraspora pellucida]|uniref:17295_t:CDS:1 n=1 Tax=Cetraspora pellucida TaxID=1433469 RepID=A0A9N9NY22_9GLOM|nr:17295_t:CDS:1 [Cetraspora pellucida]
MRTQEDKTKDLSETISLRELNSKLIAIIAELRKENAEIKTENTELKAENIKVKAENEKLKQTLEEHESRFMKLEQNDKDTATENDELKSRVAKLEQTLQNNSDNIDTNPKLLEDGTEENNNSLVVVPCKTNSNDDTLVSNVSDISSNSDKLNNTPNSNVSFENKEIEFLERVHKEHIRNEIRERKREKKLLQNDDASHNQDPVSYHKDNSCVVRIVIMETSANISGEQGLIQEINHAIKTEVNNDHPNCDNVRISANIVRPNCDNSEITQNSEIIQVIICLYRNACDAEKDAIEANQSEISCWCFYAKRFKGMVKDFMINNEIGEKKAKGQVYDFIIKRIPGTKRKNLCKQTQKALRIYNLFEKIGMDKIQFIKTYSTDTISRFTNLQIQTIIDHFAKKPNIEFADNQDNSSGEIIIMMIGMRILNLYQMPAK